jgi:hypothetical protein
MYFSDTIVPIGTKHMRNVTWVVLNILINRHMHFIKYHPTKIPAMFSVKIFQTRTTSQKAIHPSTHVEFTNERKILGKWKNNFSQKIV